MSTLPPDPIDRARALATAAGVRAGVTTDEVEEMPDLIVVSRLLEAVWGRNDEGVPIGSEVLRSLVHAQGAVTVARDPSQEIVGAAALVRSGKASTYSLIAAAGAGAADRGIGHALKLRQRAWALERGLTTMRWTFDPLVGRNARFNLVKLGATADEYVASFYGVMGDQINAGDDSDRLVACWELDSPGAVTAVEGAGEGTPIEPDEPPDGSIVMLRGPDGEPAYVTGDRSAWCRVPRDVVALRSSDLAGAATWRAVVREGLTSAFESGLTATGMSRSGWYRLTREGDS